MFGLPHYPFWTGNGRTIRSSRLPYHQNNHLTCRLQISFVFLAIVIFHDFFIESP